MKYAILFLLALAIPLSPAYAVKSPFVKYNGNEIDKVVSNKTPFSKKQSRSIREKLSQKQNAKNNYNGDEETQPVKKKKKGHKDRKSKSSGSKNFKGDQSAGNYRE